MCNLLNQLFGQSGIERPSPADIVPTSSITVDGSKLIVDYSKTNIPFTKPPKLIPSLEIPNSNSMDGLFDTGHNENYLEPADEDNHKIMVDWIAEQYEMTGGMLACDCVYRIMQSLQDDPSDFTKPHLFYAIHRVYDVDNDGERYFTFKGINNSKPDPYKVRDKNILWLSGGTIY